MTFYAIVGDNGAAVMDTAQKVEKLKKYIKNFSTCEFQEFASAEFWALAVFQERSYCGRSLSYLELNHAIFNKDILSGKTSRRRSRND